MGFVRKLSKHWQPIFKINQVIISDVLILDKPMTNLNFSGYFGRYGLNSARELKSLKPAHFWNQSLSVYFPILKIKGNRNVTLCDKVGFNVFLVDFYVLLYMENFPRVSGFSTLFSMSLTFLNIFDYFGHHIQSKTSHESIVITFKAYETKFTNPSHTFQKL